MPLYAPWKVKNFFRLDATRSRTVIQAFFTQILHNYYKKNIQIVVMASILFQPFILNGCTDRLRRYTVILAAFDSSVAKYTLMAEHTLVTKHTLVTEYALVALVFERITKSA